MNSLVTEHKINRLLFQVKNLLSFVAYIHPSLLAYETLKALEFRIDCPYFSLPYATFFIIPGWSTPLLMKFSWAQNISLKLLSFYLYLLRLVDPLLNRWGCWLYDSPKLKICLWGCYHFIFVLIYSLPLYCGKFNIWNPFSTTYFCQPFLLFSLVLLLFMSFIALFDIIYGSHCTILTNFYLHLQYF